MSIFKGTFNKSIKDQLEVRQKAINDRTPQNLSYMNYVTRGLGYHPL